MMVALGAILISGCAGGGGSAAVNPSVQIPVTATTTPKATPEVRYGTILDPQKLAAEQLAEIIAAADAVRPAGREIWMILVRENYLYKGERHFAATIYFTPDAQSERLRTGRFMGFDSMLSKWRSEVREQYALPRDEGLPRYAQVSPVSQPFGEKLTTPDGAMRPFQFPEKLTEVEVVALVDAARVVHDEGLNPDRAAEPVCNIEMSGETGEEFRVFFGAQDGMLAGRGTIVNVRRVEGGFKAEGSVGMWVS